MTNIFSPIEIKNIKIKNRIVLPPLVRFSLIEKDGFVNDKLVDWYGKIAASGVGLIIVEASAVEESGKLRENQIAIWDDKYIEGLKKISEVCHKYSVPVLIQIHHAGFKENIQNVPKERLEEILELFKKAFVRAKKANFDGIEIHGAHTYLISQLNSRLWNKREDEYGEHIFFSKRLILETKYLFNDDFILGYRMGGNEPRLEDGIEIAKDLEKLGVDLLHVSTGVQDDTFKQKCKIANFPDDFPLDWVIYMGTEIKKHVSIPVIGVRSIKYEHQASYLVENGLLDFVAVGRAMIANPKWIEKAKKEFNLRNASKNN